MMGLYWMPIVAGVVLLGINLHPSTLCPPDIGSLEDTVFHTGSELTLEEAESSLEDCSDEHGEEYLECVVSTFHKTIAHHWPPSMDIWGMEKSEYTTRVPPTENYILWSLSYIATKRRPLFKKYEFYTYEKAVERGFGLCSQQARAICDYLNRNGVSATVVSLDGHVVTEACVGSNTYIVDSDFDVVVPHSIEEIDRDPSIVRDYYRSMAQPRQVEEIEIANDTLDVVENYYSNGYDYLQTRLDMFERLSYVLCWLIPAALILFGVVILSTTP